ncbi:MAG: hypothetical protein QM723_22815 [Myxococcaceae bacterium]
MSAWVAGCNCGNNPMHAGCLSDAECSLPNRCLNGACVLPMNVGGGSGIGGGQAGGGQAGGGQAGGGQAGGGQAGGGQAGGGQAGGGQAGGGQAGGGAGGGLSMVGGGGGTNNYDGGCGPIDAGNPPYQHLCAAQTSNECDGPTDSALSGGGVAQSLLNGANGNGFDDDCDGLVDEGCACTGAGTTKDCWLVPPTMANPQTSTPVGWCSTNSKGSLDCAGGEIAFWSGQCRGAQPPGHEVCAPGDFNCDGLDGNPDDTGCMCPTPVVCPTNAITLAPYPDPANLTLIDGSQWVDASQRANIMNWTWTVVGGDCDNVLPFPTFALYSQADSTAAGARKGTRTPVQFDATAQKYTATPGQPIIAIQAANYGNGVTGGQVYPAFGLSGDYLVQGEFDLNGTHVVCTQRVEVRAPGVRAEACWDGVGDSSNGNDVDLHFARLQGNTACNGSHGWDSSCGFGNPYDDCYWSSGAGCREYSSSGPGWGYNDSASTACLGWSSRRGTGTQGCTNPRLDRDCITCDPTIDDPTNTDFCGPENINLDNPKDGDTFVVAVNHYSQFGSVPAKPHVNVYCNGQRVLSAGFNPVSGQTMFPALIDPGGDDTTGDIWTVATVTTHVAGGAITGCDTNTIPSHHADVTRDGPASQMGGGNNLCVESDGNGSTQFNYTNHFWVEPSPNQTGAAGSIPSTTANWCKH